MLLTSQLPGRHQNSQVDGRVCDVGNGGGGGEILNQTESKRETG